MEGLRIIVRVLFVVKQVDYEPLGLMLLSSVLKRAGHEVELAIASQEDPVEVAEAFGPDILGYNVLTGSQRYYLDLNRRIRQRVRAFSAFGGAHPTFFPEMIEAGEAEGLDGICIGEGEGALLDLADALAAGRSHLDIPNWWFRAAGEIVRNPVRPLVRDLDSLPVLDHHLVYSKHAPTGQSKIKHFLYSRGCPYNCSYCFNHAYTKIYDRWGHFRHLSVGRLIEEMRVVRAAYPLAFAVFVDDLFGIGDQWLEEFVRRYPREVGVPFFCNTRVNIVAEERMRLLREAGCVCVSLGIETGNDEIRQGLLNRKMEREQILSACQIIQDAGLNLTTTNMIGLPGCSLENDFETVALNAQLRPSYAHAMLFQPYPRTELGEYARKHGYMEGTFDDIFSSATDGTVLRFSSPAEKRQIENLQRFFAIAIEWPWLIPLIRQLIKLPKNGLFWLVYKLWKGYALKSRVHPVRFSLRDYIQVVRHYMRFDT